MGKSVSPLKLVTYGVTPPVNAYRGFSLEHLPAGFFIAADHQTALLIGRKCLGIELANRLGFGIKVLIVTVKPVFTLVGLEISFLQDTPDA